jgi:hypothetical protein
MPTMRTPGAGRADADAVTTVEARSECGGAADRPGRALRVVVSGLLALGLLGMWAVAAAGSGIAAYRDLEAARGDVVRAEAQLRDAELTDARASLAVGVERADRASVRLRRPWVVPLRMLPWVGPNVWAATVLSDTARDNGDAAAGLLDAAAVIVSDERNQELGEVSLTYLGELAPPARELADTLTRTTLEVQQLTAGSLIGPVARAREQFLGLVEPNLDQVVLAADFLEVMPAFLGEDEPRTYLVGAAALSEIRASGGLLGSWTVLTADQGRLSFDDFVDVDTLPLTDAAVVAPSVDYERRYARFDALRQYRNANLTPDFPSAAQVLTELWTEGGGAPVDGIIMADPIVYERLAQRSGGLDVAGYGTLAPEDTLRFVALDAYDVFLDDDQRKQVLGATATAAFAEMFQILEDDDVPATLEMLTDLADGGHLRINTRDEQVQELMQRAGVAGELPQVGGESVGFFTNNIAGNKVDWFEERRIDHHVQLLTDGVTRATLTIDLVNDAPMEGHRRGVLGPWTDLTQVGDNLLLTSFTCSITCDVTSAAAGSTDGGTEFGRPMRDSTVLIPSGEQRRWRYATSSTDAWRFDGDRIVLEVDHLVQPTLHGTHLTLRVNIPPDTTVVETPEGAEQRGDEIVLREQVSGRVQHVFVFDASALPVASD